MKHNNVSKFGAAVIVLLLILLLSGCNSPKSDSGIEFLPAEIPIDPDIFTLRGTVVTDILSIQTTQAQGYSSATQYYGYSTFSLWQEGKGFVRLLVDDASPMTNLAEPGTTIIIKTTDTKLKAILPGDMITLKCRAQYENVAATRVNEVIDIERYGTWELDFCRMVTPLVLPTLP